ncbi:MAG: O-antigen ligase family protein [Bacteroidota bacterium]|nr:O-antigen ligase family protein [Bacteroidota bacterium]
MGTGYFMHPNTASHFYTIMIPLLLYQYFAKKINFSKFLTILILFVLGLLFTFSRAGYIGASVSLLIIAYSKSKKFFFITIILLVISIYLFILDFIFAKSDSSISRVLLWATAIDMIIRDGGHSLWGYGVSNALTIFQNEKIYFGSTEEVPDPHNVILLLAIQFGLLFVISLILFLIVLFVKIYFIRHTDYFIENRTKIFLCLSITFGLISQNMVENVLAYPEHFVLNIFFIFIGYLYNFINNYEKNEFPRAALKSEG